MDYLPGIAGFIGYEGLKLYKKSWGGYKIISKSHLPVYLISLIILSLFSAIAAHIFATGNHMLALYIGFSVPTSAEKILQPKSRGKQIEIDDIVITEKKPLEKRLTYVYWYNLYFKLLYGAEHE